MVRKVQLENPGLQIRYIKNAVNIGGNANVLRAFEVCETEWLWILGDDDVISGESIAVITKSIAANPHAQYIEFASCLNACPPKEDLQFNKVDTWLASENFCFSNFLFISSGIYNAHLLSPFFSYAQHYQFTFAPHACILLLALFQGECNIVYSPFVLINWEKNLEQIWDYDYLGYRLNQVVQVVPTLKHRRLLHEKIQVTFPLVPKLSISYLLNLLAGPRETREAIFVISEFVYFTAMHQRLLLLLYSIRILQKIGVGYAVGSAIALYKRLSKRESFKLASVFGGGGPLNFPGF